MIIEDLLIVDDSGLSRRLVKKCIEALGVEVGQYHEAADGAIALGILQTKKMNVIVTDLNMPNIDGHELMQRIDFECEMAPDFVIVVTSKASQKIADELMANGVSALIGKPLQAADLQAAFEGIGLLPN
ncbi:MAG: response regulator [Planctomycetes bacterium]|nr:response regulator [Planctomycetota bacterium]